MQIRVGYDCPQPTPMLLMLSIHPTRSADLVAPDHLVINPSVPVRAHRDGFGNMCSRIVAPTGRTHLSAHRVVKDSGEPDVVANAAQQHSVDDVPDGSRLPFGQPGKPSAITPASAGILPASLSPATAA